MRALAFAAALLVLGAAPAAAGIGPFPEAPDPVSIFDGTAPTDVGGGGGIALHNQVVENAAVYALVAWVFDVGYRLHECEQGGTVNEWHPDTHNGSGYFDNGMGMMAPLYEKVMGHPGFGMPPEEQIVAAYRAKTERGAVWGGKCRFIADEWLAL